MVTPREMGGHAGEITGHVAAKRVVTIERNSQIEREAGASAVTNEPLAALIVVGFDPDRRVEIEAVEVRDEAAAAALGFEPAVAVLLRSGAPR